MTIIDQLEQTVTPVVIGNNSNVNLISLLEQFYAIVIMRVSAPDIYTELQGTELSNSSSFAPNNHSIALTTDQSSLFEQIWPQSDQRLLLIQELAATHHINESATEQTVINATPHLYQALKNLAEGQYLPAFLQAKQAEIREYLPVWALDVLSTHAENTVIPSDAVALSTLVEAESVESIATETEAVTPVQSLASDITLSKIATTPQINNDAIPIIRIDKEEGNANAAEYHTPKSLAQTRSSNQPHKLLIPLLLGLAALLAAGLIWALFFKTPNIEAVTPVVAEPVIETSKVAAPALAPAQLAVAVDNGGNLYNCSAAVGDSALQASIVQALTTSFGEQANICQITVQQGVETTLLNMDTAVLPNILMLMRAAPFSRLQLQNNSLTLEAPDNMLLQRLVADVSALVPTMTVTAVAPAAPAGLTQPPENTYDDTYNGEAINNGDTMNNNENYNADGMPNAAMSNNGNASTMPMNNNNSSNNPANQLPPQNNVNNTSLNNRTNQNSGSMSLAEAEDLANTPIVSEPAKGGRPIN